ncbi:MAG: AbrB/MazE/SpoVT family DNA-binding domain-containing protein [Kineosporiaceae bacterium]
MRVTDKGQVTIPKQLRDAVGIDAGSEVVFEQVPDGILVRKVTGPAGRGQDLVRRLRGRGDVALTTDEIMSLTRGEEP